MTRKLQAVNGRHMWGTVTHNAEAVMGQFSWGLMHGPNYPGPF
jgi:hypothetical protein